MSEDDNIIHVNFGTKTVESPKEENATPPPNVSQETLKKFEVFKEWLESNTVMITLDARRDDVQVPANLKINPQLNLNYDYRFGLPDFEFTETDGIRASLSFGGVNHYCVIPWEAVYVIRLTNQPGQMCLFEDSIPEDFRRH